MPAYDYSCRKCGEIHEQVHGMFELPSACPHCKSKKLEKVIVAPAIKPPVDSGWESENGGRGRYISQLQTEPGPPGEKDAYCRSQSEAIEKAKRRGLQVTRVR